MERFVIEVDGVLSPVLAAGPEESSEAVVFVHGNPGSGEDWEGLLGDVGVFCRAVAPDMPGYGRADKPDGLDYTIGGYGRHVHLMLDQLGIERAHLVLHDFGGAVTIPTSRSRKPTCSVRASPTPRSSSSTTAAIGLSPTTLRGPATPSSRS